jgi:hypothetical protein
VQLYKIWRKNNNQTLFFLPLLSRIYFHLSCLTFYDRMVKNKGRKTLEASKKIANKFKENESSRNREAKSSTEHTTTLSNTNLPFRKILALRKASGPIAMKATTMLVCLNATGTCSSVQRLDQHEICCGFYTAVVLAMRIYPVIDHCQRQILSTVIISVKSRRGSLNYCHKGFLRDHNLAHLLQTFFPPYLLLKKLLLSCDISARLTFCDDIFSVW